MLADALTKGARDRRPINAFKNAGIWLCHHDVVWGVAGQTTQLCRRDVV